MNHVSFSLIIIIRDSFPLQAVSVVSYADRV